MGELLLLDSSGPLGQLGFGTPTGVSARVHLDGARRHVRDITVRLRELMATVGRKLADVSAIAVNTGPGSFTGVRVGLAVAKALAYAADRPLIGVNAFDIVATPHLATTAAFAVVFPGQLGTALVARYRNGLTDRSTWTAVPRGRLAVDLGPDLPVTGPGLVGASETLPNPVLGQPDWQPRLDELNLVASARFARLAFDDPFGLEPEYVRPSSAEEKWAAAGRP